jgi:hypothetical protein
MRTIGRIGVITFSIVAALVLLGGTCISTYNKLVRLDQNAKAQWAQVENAYQRRADRVACGTSSRAMRSTQLLHRDRRANSLTRCTGYSR